MPYLNLTFLTLIFFLFRGLSEAGGDINRFEPSDLIRKGDLLEIVVRVESVEADSRLILKTLVDAADSTPIGISEIGNFSVIGRSVGELRSDILKYVESQQSGMYSVGVRIVRPASQDVVIVMGLVNFEGPVRFEKDMKVSDALELAGGIRANADLTNVRLKSSNSVRVLNLKTDIDQGLKLKQGDSIFIP